MDGLEELVEEGFEVSLVDNYVLYKWSDDTANEVMRNITEIMCYSDADEPHIIYQTNSGEYQSASSLYIAYADEEPEMISDNVNTVAFDEYKPGGNLYYGGLLPEK